MSTTRNPIQHLRAGDDIPRRYEHGETVKRVIYDAEVDFPWAVLTLRERECCAPPEQEKDFEVRGSDARDVVTRWLEEAPEFVRHHSSPPDVFVVWAK